jgi:hypothetical protein
VIDSNELDSGQFIKGSDDMRLLILTSIVFLAACQTMTHDPEEIALENGDEVLMEEYCQYHGCRGV